MNTFEDLQEIHVILIRFEPEWSHRDQMLDHLETNFVDYETFEYDHSAEKFENTTNGKFLCTRYNWYLKRMQEFKRTRPDKKLCVHNWGLRTGDSKLFVYKGQLYPNIAHTFDAEKEHWFFARATDADRQLELKYVSTNLKLPRCIKRSLDLYRQQSVQIIRMPNGAASEFQINETGLMNQVIPEAPVEEDLAEKRDAWTNIKEPRLQTYSCPQVVRNVQVPPSLLSTVWNGLRVAWNSFIGMSS